MKQIINFQKKKRRYILVVNKYSRADGIPRTVQNILMRYIWTYADYAPKSRRRTASVPIETRDNRRKNWKKENKWWYTGGIVSSQTSIINYGERDKMIDWNCLHTHTHCAPPSIYRSTLANWISLQKKKIWTDKRKTPRFYQRKNLALNYLRQEPTFCCCWGTRAIAWKKKITDAFE